MQENIRFAIGIIRPDELIAEAKRAAEIGGPGLLGEEGIGSGFDDAAVDGVGRDHAGEMGRRFVEPVFDCACAALFLEGEGGGESRDAPADDGDANHEWWLRAPGFRPRDDRFTGEYSCTKRARFFTFSTGVSGRMPWPRLKISPCPPPPP